MSITTNENDNEVKRRARRSLFLRFFVLPSVDKRRIPQWLLSKGLVPSDFKTESDDTYIYYRLVRGSFALAVAFSLLYLISYISGADINLHWFSIHVVSDHLVSSMARTYPYVVATLSFLIFIPYGWLLFAANVDMNNLDLLQWNPRALRTLGNNRSRIIERYRIFVIIFFAMNYGSAVVPTYLLQVNPALDTSAILFAFCLAFFPFVCGYSTYGVFMGCAVLYQHWKRIGPFYKNSFDPNDS